MRRAAKRDANELAIVEALETCGCTVRRLNDADLPDLVVWRPAWGSFVRLLEVKSPAGVERRGQAACPLPRAIVRTVPEAIAAADLQVR